MVATLVVGVIFRAQMLYINLGDTYYGASYLSIALVLSFLMLCCGIILALLRKRHT